jgi:hypothetical protein
MESSECNVCAVAATIVKKELQEEERRDEK